MIAVQWYFNSLRVGSQGVNLELGGTARKNIFSLSSNTEAQLCAPMARFSSVVVENLNVRNNVLWDSVL